MNLAVSLGTNSTAQRHGSRVFGFVGTAVRIQRTAQAWAWGVRIYGMRWIVFTAALFLLGAFGLSDPDEQPGGGEERACAGAAQAPGEGAGAQGPVGLEASKEKAPGARAEQIGPVIAWDQSETDEAGKPVELEYAEIALTDSSEDIRKVDRPVANAKVPVRKGENSADLGALFPQVPSRAYRVWVRVVDRKGTPSEWTGPLEVELRSQAGRSEDKASPPSVPGSDTKKTATASSVRSAGSEALGPGAGPGSTAASPETRPGAETQKILERASRAGDSGARAPAEVDRPSIPPDPRTQPWRRRTPGGCTLFR